jgi:hypothetical protein
MDGWFVGWMVGWLVGFLREANSLKRPPKRTRPAQPTCGCFRNASAYVNPFSWLSQIATPGAMDQSRHSSPGAPAGRILLRSTAASPPSPLSSIPLSAAIILAMEGVLVNQGFRSWARYLGHQDDTCQTYGRCIRQLGGPTLGTDYRTADMQLSTYTTKSKLHGPESNPRRPATNDPLACTPPSPCAGCPCT